jgi:hypothetical protein
MKKTILIVGSIAVILLLAGIYKFNFTNSDIYVKDSEGKTIPIDQAKNINQNTGSKELKTKTGKIIIITETHPVGQSISSIAITTKGFKENKLIELNDIDPIEKIELKDLDNDGFEEIYLFTRSVGSGSGGDFYVYASDKDKRLVKYEKEELEEKEYLKGGRLEGYMGHDTCFFDKEMLVMEFRIYKENDANLKPTGGTKKVFYGLNQSKFKIKKIEIN